MAPFPFVATIETELGEEARLAQNYTELQNYTRSRVRLNCKPLSPRQKGIVILSTLEKGHLSIATELAV